MSDDLFISDGRFFDKTGKLLYQKSLTFYDLRSLVQLQDYDDPVLILPSWASGEDFIEDATHLILMGRVMGIDARESYEWGGIKFISLDRDSLKSILNIVKEPRL